MSRIVHPRTEATSSRDGGGSVVSTATGGRAIKQPRDTRGPTKLERPRNFQKIEITPKGDAHFSYVHFTPNLARQTGSVLGAALRREYPGLVKEFVGPGRRPRIRLAFSWIQYHGEKDENGLTAADRVKEEFWSFFTADDELLEELDQNIEKYCQDRVPKILCQARVDAVKKFCGKDGKGQKLGNVELDYEQYKSCKLDWFSDEAWNAMCHWWTSEKYKELRKKGQEARFTNEDYAQQRGGSLPFPTIQQNLEYRFGPEKAGGLDTYKVQMAGFKASLSGSGKTLSKKVQMRIADYSEAMEKEYGEEWEKRNELDGMVLYQTFDGLKHGRFAMGNGSLKKADVLATVKHKRPRYSGTSYQALQRQNENLHQELAELRDRDARREQMMQHQQDLLKALCEKVNIDIPPTILTSWESQQARTSESRIDDSNNSEQEGVHAE